MKVLKITTVYDEYWQLFYKNRSDLGNQFYVLQKKLLDFDGFGWADFWSHHLKPLGYEMIEIISNIPYLQKAWAQENDVKFDSNWSLKIPFEQVIKFQPDILFMEDYITFSQLWLAELKAACSSIQLVIGWCGAPFQNIHVFNEYDIVLSCIPELVKQFQDMGHWSEHLNHAFQSQILERIDLSIKPDIDFSFVGQINRNNHYHLRRDSILEQVSQSIPIQIFSPQADISIWDDKIKTLLKQSSYKLLDLLRVLGLSERELTRIPKIGKFASIKERPLSPVNPRLKKFMKPAVFGLQMYQTLQRSKLTFNAHVDISPRSASNMRIFEATGVGTCLITDWKENIHALFEPSQEIVTYKSAEECIEKVLWLLEHPQEREAIAKAGQARTLKDHTFAQRAIQLDQIIQRALKRSR